MKNLNTVLLVIAALIGGFLIFQLAKRYRNRQSGSPSDTGSDTGTGTGVGTTSTIGVEPDANASLRVFREGGLTQPVVPKAPVKSPVSSRPSTQPSVPPSGQKQMGQCDAFMKHCAGKQGTNDWKIYDCDTKFEMCMKGYNAPIKAQ